MNWFYIDESILEGERRQGPVQLADLQALQEQNKINDTTLVWHKGLDNWISWKEAREKEAENDPQANELLLRETVESILRERAEEWQQRAYAGFFIRAAAFLIDWILIAVLWEISAQILGMFSVFDLAATSEAANALIEKYTRTRASPSFPPNFQTSRHDRAIPFVAGHPDHLLCRLQRISLGNARKTSLPPENRKSRPPRAQAFRSRCPLHL